MWLINTTTLELHEFIDVRHAPSYAILSHCWGEGEISFKDFQKKRNCTGPGYDKIVNCCKHAREVGYHGQSLGWAWVDTCCIDKRSSSELSEAINSMFKWYRQAFICYALLPDVPDTSDRNTCAGEMAREGVRSRWFTRGWTLQELIAPPQVLFFDSGWDLVGSKCPESWTMCWEYEIFRTTHIPVDVLRGFYLVRRCSVAERMSWANSRNTTREEDMAYCLLGLFDINMPLLYGEGPEAFQRLQNELLRQGRGDSLLAYRDPFMRSTVPFLAGHPDFFADSHDIIEGRNQGAGLFRSNGRLFELTIPKYPQWSVYCHREYRELLVRLACYRLVPPDQRHRPARRVLRLLYFAECGHYSVSPYGEDKHPVYGEDDIADLKCYRPLQVSGTVNIHRNTEDIAGCRGLAAPLFPKVGFGSPEFLDPQTVIIEDRRRLNIQ